MSGTLLTTEARNAAATAILNLLNAGTGESAGSIRLADSSNVTVALLRLNNPAFGSPTTGVATMGTSPAVEDDDAAGGTVTTATGAGCEFRDRDDNVVFFATVNTTGAPITLDPLTIPAGAKVTATSVTFTVPAGP